MAHGALYCRVRPHICRINAIERRGQHGRQDSDQQAAAGTRAEVGAESQGSFGFRHAPYSHGVAQEVIDMRTKNYNCPALLSEAVTQMVDDSEIPLKAIARDLGMPYTSLYRKLDPADDAMKVEVDLLFPLTKLCCGNRPKEPPMSMFWLPSKFGFRLAHGEAEPDKADVRDEMLDDCKMLREFHEAMRAGEHPSYVSKFYARIHQELDESMTRYERDYAKQKEGK